MSKEAVKLIVLNQKLLKVSSQGPYVQSDWTDFADKFGSYDISKLPRILTPDNYQDWLNIYYDFIRSKFKISDPFELTIEKARQRSIVRPLWARTYAEKGYSRKSTKTAGLIDIVLSGDTWNTGLHYAERDIVLNPKGEQVLIERALSPSGALRELSVLRPLEEPNSYWLTCESRIYAYRFGLEESRQIKTDISFDALAHADTNVRSLLKN